VAAQLAASQEALSSMKLILACLRFEVLRNYGFTEFDTLYGGVWVSVFRRDLLHEY
jgi:hypothetical protein